MIPSIRKIRFRQLRKKITSSHTLSYLFWECTLRCNLTCLHCGSDCKSDSSVKDMPMDDFLSALDTIPSPKSNFLVVLTGGEPLLRKDIETCGREIRKRGMRWSMVSNGYLYHSERHISLLNAGMGALTISLDGLESTHNWLRNSKYPFSRLTEAIQLAAHTKRLNFDVVTCVHKKNIDELLKMFDLLNGLGVKTWRLFTISPIGRAKNNEDLHLSGDEFVRLMNFIRLSRQKKEMQVHFSCEGYVGPYEAKVRDGYFFCRAGINIGSILIDGSVSACPNIDRSFTQGNIYEDNFFKIWQSKFIPFRKKEWMKKGKCSDCSEFNMCLGNGFHYWQRNREDVMVCHLEKIKALKNR